MTILSPEYLPALITMGVLALMFALFVAEVHPPEVTAIGAVALLLLTGVLTLDDVLAAVANPAPLAIAAMFIISGALVALAKIGDARDEGGEPKSRMADEIKRHLTSGNQEIQVVGTDSASTIRPAEIRLARGVLAPAE